MPTILSRIFLLYHLFNSTILFLIPKKLRSLLLPSSWLPHHQPNTITKNPSPSSQTISFSLHSASKRMDSTELKRVFQMFDKNGDGRISQKELNDSLENLGIFIPEKELTQMIERIDVNGDGCVDIDEFGVVYQSMMDDKGEEKEEDDMKEAFDVFDQNGDGFISVDELRSVLDSLGIKPGRTREDCKKMIMKVDVDGDGMVNYKEFRLMMKGSGFGALN